MTAAAVTFDRVANGRFIVLFDGAPTDYEIQRADCARPETLPPGAFAGRARCIYGLTNNARQTTRWLGSLARCKQTIARTLAHRAESPTAAAVGLVLVAPEKRAAKRDDLRAYPFLADVRALEQRADADRASAAIDRAESLGGDR